MLTRGDGAVGDGMRERDKARHTGGAGGETVGDSAIGGEQVARVTQPLVIGGRGHAGEAVIAGGIVVGHSVVE